MITGLAALALHGFSSAPPLLSLDTFDVLVPRMRRLRSTGCVRIVRSSALPVPSRSRGSRSPRSRAPSPTRWPDSRTRAPYAGC